MRLLLPLFAFLIFFNFSLHADVIDVNIESHELVLDGKPFGDVGAYELLKGNVTFGIDPTNPANKNITDIHLVQKLENGLIIVKSEMVILKPVEMSKGCGTALFEVSNRGGKASPSYFNRATKSKLLLVDDPAYWGDGLLMEKGLTVIWIGWQFDVPFKEELLNIEIPIAKNKDGSSITGLVRADWTVDEESNFFSLGHGGNNGYPVSEKLGGRNVLTYRIGRDAERILVPRSAWKFGMLDGDDFKADDRHIYMENGFETGYIYELVYESKNPPVVGLGLAAIRDMMSYVKYDINCSFKVENGIAVGVSQTGRFLRYYLYKGFNTDEAKRKVFDGMLIITAGAGRGSFNHRFAQPSRDAHRYSAFYYPTDIYPFTSHPQKQKKTKRYEGLYLHETRPPKLFYINTGYEYWGRSASLIHTNLKGKKDVLPYSNERIYHIASGQHFVNNWPLRESQLMLGGAYRGNHLQFKPNYRALLVRMLEWVNDNKVPPVSRFPKISNKTLVDRKKMMYPEIPGIFYPATIHTAHQVDYGSRWLTEGIIDNQPPKVGKAYPSKIAKVDPIGNELAGIRNVEVAVPLGTYFPWNVRLGQDGGSFELTNFKGTFIPLPKDEIIRNENGDSRPSVEGLYKSKSDYLIKIKAAASQLVYDGFLLSRDQPYVTKRAEDYWDKLIE